MEWHKLVLQGRANLKHFMGHRTSCTCIELCPCNVCGVCSIHVKLYSLGYSWQSGFVFMCNQCVSIQESIQEETEAPVLRAIPHGLWARRRCTSTAVVRKNRTTPCPSTGARK
jgi:hypothetical protein